MKTEKIKIYAQAIDEKIPDLTTDVAIDKTVNIWKGIENTFTCLGCALLCSTTVIVNTTELAVITSKTAGKKAYSKAKDVYMSDKSKVVIRR